MTFTVKLNLDNFKMNQHAKYLAQRSFSSLVIVRAHTHCTDCSTWATKVVGKSPGHTPVHSNNMIELTKG